MPRVFGVIADDFTGACDAGVQFKKFGFETLVLANAKNLDKLEPFYDVVVVNTDTRNVDPKQAYSDVRRIVKSFRNLGIKLFYKKVDSTLRGNIGAEIDAVLDELDYDCVFFASSYPEQGRTVIDGQVFVKGVPLKDTEFAQDMLNPIKESSVQKIVELQSSRKVGHIGISIVRKGASKFKSNLEELLERGNEIVVTDAETQKDLVTIVNGSKNMNVLLCGSAGLAKAAASFLTKGRQVLIITGSINDVTLSQIKMVHKKFGIPIIEPDIANVFEDDHGLMGVAKNLAEKAEAILSGNRHVIIRLACSKNVVQRIIEAGKDLGLDAAQIIDKLLLILGCAVREIVETHDGIRIVSIGGDTSKMIMQAIGAEGIKLDCEILPGIAVGRIISGKYVGSMIATKAGGFGDEQALAKVFEYMKDPRTMCYR